MAVGLAFAPSGVTVGEAPFSPSSIFGLTAWYKADAITGKSDGDAVASWIDSSGNSNDISHGTGANQPTYKTGIVNGKPVVRFDGTSDWLQKSSTTVPQGTAAMTLFFVATTTGAANRILMAAGNTEAGASGWRISNVGTTGRITTPGVQDYDFSNAWTANDTFYVQSVTFDADADFEWFTNGSTLGAVGGSTFASGGSLFTVGGGTGNEWPGDIAEIAIYSVLLSGDDRRLVEAYLGVKYGITVV